LQLKKNLESVTQHLLIGRERYEIRRKLEKEAAEKESELRGPQSGPMDTSSNASPSNVDRQQMPSAELKSDDCRQPMYTSEVKTDPGRDSAASSAAAAAESKSARHRKPLSEEERRNASFLATMQAQIGRDTEVSACSVAANLLGYLDRFRHH